MDPNLPAEENAIADITKRILEAPRQRKVKDMKRPSTEGFATGTYEDKLFRVEELIHGLANYLQMKGNVHHLIILYTGCLERAIITLHLAGRPELPGTTMNEATPTQTAPTAVPAQNRKGYKRPASLLGPIKTPKRSTRATREDVRSTVDKD
ncbi:unnamed protein product [Trichogramma brassicae]|uniref:Uncharacterized protein n=1 Tax=Trichogramma brassicae TaxID=86971 RepID=A0A6H5ISC8_9HYME|nr:unnamed protein product [Trichogramma brassicae]